MIASQLRIGVVGCGAISEIYHLPALAAEPRVSQLLLADPAEDRRLAMAEKFSAYQTVADYRQLDGLVDGVIVAVPPALHHDISLFFLERGVHVLCEKPLAESMPEAVAMVTAADRAQVTLSVNQTRRLFPTYGKIRQLIKQGELGQLQSITYFDGVEFDWPAASPHHFQATAKGAWSDTGVHLLDSICWWLGGKPRLVSSRNDSFGGPEALATVELDHQGCPIEIKVSRLGKLPNGFRIVGSRAWIEAAAEDWNCITVQYHSGKSRRCRCGRMQKYTDCAQPLIANFIDVLAGRSQPLVPARDTLATIELLEQAYQAAEPYDMPWNTYWNAEHVS